MSKDKVKKFGDLAYEYIRKKLIKPGKGGITSLPTDKEITDEMLLLFENLREAGYNVTNIGKEVKNADDLGFLINRIEQAKINQAKEFSDAADALETIQYKLNNNIPLNPDDQKKLLGSGFKTATEAFQGFKPKIIQGGKQVDVKLPKSAKKDMLESYDNLFLKGEDTKYDADVLATDLAERRGFIKEGQDSTDMDQKKYSDLYSEAYSFLTELRFLNRPPRKQSKESTVKNVAEAMFGPIGKKEEGIKSLDLAKELEELTNKNLKERGLGEIKLGDKLPEPKKKKPAVDPELQKSEDLKKEFKDFEDRNPDEKAMGGRIGMVKGGGILKFLSENNPIQAYKKYLESVKRRSIEGDFKSLAPELGAISAGGILVNRKMKSILEEGNELQKERFLKDYIEELNNDPKYKDRPELKDKMIENYTESLFGEKKAMGGRIGFKEGGGMTRRTFLKLLGGLASIPLVGKFLKPAAKVAKTAEIAKQGGVPAYFPKLVDKIKLLGDDVTDTAATVERQRVIDYKDYTLTEDISTGAITIDKRTEGGGMFRVGDEIEYESGIVREERMEYTPPETIIGKDNKPVKVPAQYEEITVKPDFEGKMKDVDFGLDSYDEILKEVGESKIKKSGGGLAYMMGE
jgi:hypothetical protein